MEYPLPHVPEQSRFAVVRAATRRARTMIYLGGSPLLQTTARKPEKQELRAGLVPFTIIRPSSGPFLLATPEPAAEATPALDAA